MRVLDALGPIPSARVVLDFETYYSADYSLSKLTTEAYVRDPRFEVIGVGVKVGSRPSVWMEADAFRAWASRVRWEGVALLAHHAHFDGFALSHHFGIRPGFWLDTLSMSRALRGPGKGNDLGSTAERFGVGRKGEERERAIGKRRRDFTPEEWLRYGVYCNNDVELTASLAERMLTGFPLEELWLIDMTVRMFTEPAFVADLDLLGRTLDDEREKKRKVLTAVAQQAGVQVPPGATVEQALEAARKVLSSSDKFADLLRSLGVEPGTKEGKKGTIYAFAASDPAMHALLEHERDEVRALAESRLTVKSTLIETRTERFIGIARRGPFPIYLKYCGAHTNRWSGGDSQNAQNLNRGGALRAALLAPPGHVLVAADSGQIEARVTAWVSGEQGVLDTFRRLDALGYDERGEPLGDFYSERGSVYFGKPLSKKTTPVERQTAKSMELGLGFGQGWFSFAANLLKGFMGAPPVQFTAEQVALFGVDVAEFRDVPQWRGGPTGAERVAELEATGARLKHPGPGALLIHCAVTAHLVRLYRRSNARVAAFWKTCDQLLGVMEPSEGDPLAVRARVGPLEILRHAIRKPNGLVLHYPGLKRTANGYMYLGGKSGREPTSVYGGLLTENIVQSLARDVMAEQALWARAAGYKVATTTHDEIVLVVPEANGARALADMLRIMKRPPAWCAGLPLNATGAVARSYGDCK